MRLTTTGTPPQGFLDLRAALSTRGTSINVIGVVEHCWEPAPTRGSDWQCSFNLQDESITQVPPNTGGLKVKFFIKSQNEAPKVQSKGDVVVLRHIKVHELYGKTFALSNHQHRAQCIVFPSSSIPNPHFNQAYAAGSQHIPHFSCPQHLNPTPAEQMYVISLHHALCQVSHPNIPAAPNESHAVAPATAQEASRPIFSASRYREKFALVKDCGAGRFYDLVVEVIKKYPTGSSCEVYVTDYTKNNLLFRYNPPKEEGDDEGLGVEGDSYNYTGLHRNRQWPGPFGQMTLQVKLWEPHASHAMREIQEGDRVFLKNVHIKFGRESTHLEGALHQDREFLERIDIRKVTSQDFRVQDLENRKQAYLARASASHNGKNEKQSKKEKRARKREKRKLKEQPTQLPKTFSNTHVRCQRVNSPLTPITEIFDDSHRKYTHNGIEYILPFVNANYRSSVRVVDFFPHDLEDFSHPLFDPEYNNLDPDSSSMSLTDPSQSPQHWEWAFYLLVEDSRRPPGIKNPARMQLLVADKEAEYLLKLDAKNLHGDKDTLAQLKEKLFILWGNLEELKSAGEYTLDSPSAKISNSPFECCISEFGIEAASAGRENSDGETDSSLGWKRMFRMFGTTIM